jgi:hypothetical protein
VKRYSLYFLVLANLVPVLGVLWLGWSLFSIMFFYWLESAVVGLYNIPKMLMARVSADTEVTVLRSGASVPARLFVFGFFTVHYGIFMLGHGLFIFQLFGPSDLSVTTVVLGIVSLAISHGISFKTNYIDHKEYEKVTVSQQMFAPYRRIVIMHVTIILGGMLVSFFGAPVLALVFMVLLKIAIDVVAHLREHARLGTFTGSRIFGR